MFRKRQNFPFIPSLHFWSWLLIYFVLFSFPAFICDPHLSPMWVHREKSLTQGTRPTGECDECSLHDVCHSHLLTDVALTDCCRAPCQLRPSQMVSQCLTWRKTSLDEISFLWSNDRVGFIWSFKLVSQILVNCFGWKRQCKNEHLGKTLTERVKILSTLEEICIWKGLREPIDWPEFKGMESGDMQMIVRSVFNHKIVYRSEQMLALIPCELTLVLSLFSGGGAV